jgi:outer membrane protein TolC
LKVRVSSLDRARNAIDLVMATVDAPGVGTTTANGKNGGHHENVKAQYVHEIQDPKLPQLIRTALKQDYDLQLATERINAARA